MQVLGTTLKGCKEYIQGGLSVYMPSEAEKAKTAKTAKLSEEKRLAASFKQTCERHAALAEHAKKGKISEFLVSIISGADPREILEKLKADPNNAGKSHNELLQMAEENRKAANFASRLNQVIPTLSSLSGLISALTSGGGLFQSLYGVGSSLSMPFLVNWLLAKALHYCPNQGIASTVETLGNLWAYPLVSDFVNNTVGQAFASLDGRGGNSRNMAAYSQMPAMRGGGLTLAR